MNAKKCDRCGRYYDNYRKQTYTLRKASEYLHGKDFTEDTDEVDLCEKCSIELFEWFSGGSDNE